MQTACEKLIRILSLEETMGYMNQAIIGGLDRFAPYWREDALRHGASEALRGEIEQIVGGLESYPTYETVDQRRTIVSGLLEQLRAILDSLDTLVLPAPMPAGDHKPGLPPAAKPAQATQTARDRDNVPGTGAAPARETWRVAIR
jgi:hypothetical protein